MWKPSMSKNSALRGETGLYFVTAALFLLTLWRGLWTCPAVGSRQYCETLQTTTPLNPMVCCGRGVRHRFAFDRELVWFSMSF